MAEKRNTNAGEADAELMSRFSRIDSAIARDLEQRRRSRRIYWVLLVLAIAVGLAAALFGTSQPAQVARAVVDDPQLRGQLASEPALATAVVEAPAVQQQVSEAARVAAVEAAGSAAFAENLARSPGFPDTVGVAALRAFEARPEYRERLGKLAGGNEALEAEVRQLAADLASLRELVSTMRDSTPADGTVDARLDSIAGRQAELVAAMDRQLELDAQASARIDALAVGFAALQAQFAEQARLRDAATANPLATLSYLLRENASNPLAGVGLTVSLGRRSDRTIENVRVSDGGGTVYPASATAGAAGTAVDLGEQFAFTDSSGTRYAAVFTYSQNRILWRDYVGLDLYRLPGTSDRPRD